MEKKSQELVVIDNKTSTQIKSVPVPSPKNGLRDTLIGPKVSPKPKQASRMNRFAKSIRICGLHTSVTVDQINDYITGNTPITDKARFSCKMLVKRDQDLKDVSFISFKMTLQKTTLICL